MGDLDIDYASLDVVATAMRTAMETISSATCAFGGPAALDHGAFTEKGDKAAADYDEQLTQMRRFLTNTQHGYDQFGLAAATVATVVRQHDEKLGHDAHGHGAARGTGTGAGQGGS